MYAPHPHSLGSPAFPDRRRLARRRPSTTPHPRPSRRTTPVVCNPRTTTHTHTALLLFRGKRS